MTIRDNSQRIRLRQQLLARQKHPAFIVRLPLLGLAEVWPQDGKAVIFPGYGGVIVHDWFSFCRYVRRHRGF